MTGAGTVQTDSASEFETLYAGYRWDGESPQMYYVRNRFLLPVIGTWNKRDPLGYVDGMALLRLYATLSSADPLGLFEDFDIFQPNPIRLPVGGPGRHCAACHPPSRPDKPLPHWTETNIYDPLVRRLREICSLCWEDPQCTECIDIYTCFEDADRVAKAIADTVKENWSIISVKPREGGYYCYAWSYAFKKSFDFSAKGGCFSAQLGYATVPLEPGEPERAGQKVHHWLWITSQCGESVYVDDGFKDGRFVHPKPPRPEGYKGANQTTCEHIDSEYPGRDRPEPCDYNDNPIDGPRFAPTQTR